MKRLLIFLLLFSMISSLWAQEEIAVSGRVVSTDDGGPMPGVSVYVKGTTIGTVTDVEGYFKLDVQNTDDILVFSFVGYTTEEVPIGNQTFFDVNLSPDIFELQTIVVTALGIEREQKALGYTAQQIDGEQLNVAKEINVVNSLSGKVAGVFVNQAGTGPGGTSNVVIRGFASLNPTVDASNAPLYVIDGVPMTNPQGGGAQFGGIDLGDGISNLNPDDIESMNVLKGASATALYGSRGQNGVIMITTKKGTKRKGIGVDVSSSVMFEQPLVLPEFQNQFGRGSGGNFPVDNNGNFSDNARVSWGERMLGQTEVDGNTLVNWTGQPTPYASQEDNISDFFRTGKTFINSVTLSGGNEKSQGILSISNLQNEGIMPNSELDRTTVNLRISHKLSDKLSFDGKINYIRQEVFNRPNLALSPDNPMNSLIQMPRSIRLDDLRDFRNPDGSARVYTNATGTDFWQNPYWAVNLNTNSDNRDRIIGFVSVKYDFTDWLSLQLRSGRDFFNDRREFRNATGTIYRTTPDKAYYSVTDARFSETNSDFLLAFNPAPKGDFSFSGMVGGNLLKIESESLNNVGLGLNVPDFFVIQNAQSVQTTEGRSVREIHSLYGSAQVDYKNMIFLELTARNDWSSTLPPDEWSYFYPSASASVVFTDLFEMDDDILSFGKLRASVAGVGNDTQPHQLDLVYFVNALSHDGQSFGQLVPTRPPIDLKPEFTTSYEFGVDLAFFQGRLNLDATYYNAGTRNQIYATPGSKPSGFDDALINGGLVRNQGVELMLSGKILKQDDWAWNSMINFARNRSNVEELSDEVTTIPYETFDQFGVRIQAEVGDPFGNIYADRSYLRDPETGQRIIGDNGLPIPDPSGELVKIGNFQPDWFAGITNTVTYKSLSLSFLVDIRKGGDIFSFSNSVAADNGNAEFTLDQRAEWYAGAGGFIAEGIREDGSPNTEEVDPQAYWQFVGGQGAAFAEEFLYDGSFVKLRELTLGYQLPQKLLEKTVFKNVRLSFVGRNLFFIHKNTPGFDPEATFNSGKSQGIEAFAFPSTRSFGFNLNLSI